MSQVAKVGKRCPCCDVYTTNDSEEMKIHQIICEPDKTETLFEAESEETESPAVLKSGDSKEIDSPLAMKGADSNGFESPEGMKSGDSKEIDSPLAMKGADSKGFESPEGMKSGDSPPASDGDAKKNNSSPSSSVASDGSWATKWEDMKIMNQRIQEAVDSALDKLVARTEAVEKREKVLEEREKAAFRREVTVAFREIAVVNREKKVEKREEDAENLDNDLNSKIQEYQKSMMEIDDSYLRCQKLVKKEEVARKSYLTEWESDLVSQQDVRLEMERALDMNSQLLASKVFAHNEDSNELKSLINRRWQKSLETEKTVVAGEEDAREKFLTEWETDLVAMNELRINKERAYNVKKQLLDDKEYAYVLDSNELKTLINSRWQRALETEKTVALREEKVLAEQEHLLSEKRCLEEEKECVEEEKQRLKQLEETLIAREKKTLEN